MPTYQVCNLVVHSQIALPELYAIDFPTAIDASIKFEPINCTQRPLDSIDLHFECDDNHIFLYWKTIGSFLIRDKREILVDPLPGVETDRIRVPLLGVILALLLHQRGLLVLHGSAVTIGDKAVAFIAQKGMGKSTTAAALYKRGHNHLTDDIVAVDFTDEGQPIVYPAFPIFKLWPDAIHSLGEDPENLQPIMEDALKRIRPVIRNFATEPVPLARVYALTLGENLEIKPLAPQQALQQLIAHSYCTRYGDQMLKGPNGIRHLQQCGQLVKHAPVALLQRQRSLEALPNIAQLIEHDLRS